MTEKEFFNKLWPQNCGDVLKIIEKTSIKDTNNHHYLYRCQFLKYPYEGLFQKSNIIKGTVLNPQIEQVEFIDKIWPQNCGDSLRIIEKSTQKGSGKFLWKCEFIKYKNIVFAQKEKIIKGVILNPQIEQVEFIDKIWHQNCGDSLKIINKTDKKDGKDFLWKCEFQKYPCEILLRKSDILVGNVDNPNLPWKKEETLKIFIEYTFGKKKPTIQELADNLGISRSTIGQYINNFNLRNLIQYYPESIQEKEIRNFCLLLNSSTQKKENCDILNGKEIDIYIPNRKLGIEFNGNLWHSNHPKFGRKEKNYHQEKSLLAQEKGIQLFHIWEWEWNLKQEIIKSLIKSKLGIFEKKIGASKCKIKELSNQEYQIFCEENHLQGSCGAKVKLGLYFKEELIQIMSFGVPRFTNNFEWEILRECSKLGYYIIGGKQRLWKYFIKKWNPNNCISYCDFGKFTGDSYLKLGFKKERLNKPGFVWWDDKKNQIFWRNPYKNKEMEQARYLKLFDAGQLIFIWNK
jgi:hypothetical protein